LASGTVAFTSTDSSPGAVVISFGDVKFYPVLETTNKSKSCPKVHLKITLRADGETGLIGVTRDEFGATPEEFMSGT